MGTQFTPGPWGPDDTVDIRGSAVQIAFLCAAEPGSDSDVEARANLALIAAAPDMYDVLADIEDHLTSGRAARPEGYEEGQQLRARLQAALSKARGDQS